MTGWLDDAACRGRPTDWWYPGQGDQFAARVAKLVCKGCPVRRRCLDAALEEEVVDGPRYGIRGGLGPVERVALARRAARHPVLAPVAVAVSSGRGTRPGRPYAAAL